MDESKQQWLSMAAVALVIVGLGFFLYRQSREPGVPEPTPSLEVTAEEKAQKLVSDMQVTLPDKAEKTALKDIKDEGNTGLASRVVDDTKVVVSVLAALPELKPNERYNVYLSKDESVAGTRLIGKLTSAKGGWKLDYSGRADLKDYKKVAVKLESSSNKTSESLLEGEFR